MITVQNFGVNQEAELMNNRIKIRKNTFETNSSSAHTFALKNESKYVSKKRNYLIFYG